MNRKPRVKRGYDLILIGILLLGLQQIAGAMTIQFKARLAPILIEQAWQETLASGNREVKPWPWADTWPVARLAVPTQQVDLLVLAGDTGNALAFGPGHTLASAALGSPGRAVIGGHRDTHFAFLEHLQIGDELILGLASGASQRYQVAALEVVDAHKGRLSTAPGSETLVLVTCYPFRTLTLGGPLRYKVTAFRRS